MSHMPRISVCMSVYNGERYLDEAIDSILAQTCGDFEFLIIDDGSTDGSRAILERYAARDVRIRLNSRPNTGLAVALNEMIAMARGEYIARMDADDFSLPERFEKQLAFLDENPEYDLVGSRVTIIDPNGSPLGVMGDCLTHEEIDAALIGAKGQMIYHPAVMMRKRAVEEAGGYRAEYKVAQDLDLFLRMAERGRLANLAEPLLRYREHLDKVGHTRTAEQNNVIIRALSDAHRRRGLGPFALPPDAPVHQPVSVAKRRRIWAWWALSSGYVATARKHALASVARDPLGLESWRVLYCTLRGH
ncbi:Putative glycosyltransferase EpsE [Aquisphaera giovannonii]|uniref:Glycosyltransferase EpsE n=1 Tax=Aquisphaera giovannonii TaxID=406548 RepID=A0A5B9VU72_9BACT|nr:glycosyltransferase [Aquisphaera giovannonii]QEH31923.1 Putative glycosyltransferase EpsE [Aquisphaera giovannonii]